MPAVLQLHSLKAAASDAASGGDLPAAAALFRQVLELQTAMLGPDHPDLAPTLNNLALMLERSGDTAEAGRCYRRALALATLAHGPDAPSVRVSRANLAAFYREHGADDNDDPDVSPGGLDDFAPRSSPASLPPAALAHPTTPSPAALVSAPPVTHALPVTARPAPPAAASIAPPPAALAPPAPPRPPAPRPWRNPEALVAIPKQPEVRLPIFAARRPPAPLPAPAMRPLFVPQEAAPSAWRRTAGGMLLLALGIVLAGVPAWWLRGGGDSSVEPPATGVEAPGVGTSGNASSEGTIAKNEAAVSTEVAAAAEEHSDPAAASTATGERLPVTEAEAGDRSTPADDEARDQSASTDDDLAAPRGAAAAPTPPDATSSIPLRVAESGLCAELSIGQGPWRCEPTRDTTRGASVYYYTRVASPVDELIRHRWTRDGRLVQMVVLRILTNTGEGYRTFSRQSGPLLEAGTWQVALLAPDGRVLDETEFIVR